MKSIRSKILIVVIFGLCVITAVVSAIGVNMAHEIMHKDADRILKYVTQKEAAYINDSLGDVKKSAKIMEHYAVNEIKDLDELANAEFLSNYLEKTKKMFSEIAVNTNGIEGYFFRLNPKYTDGTTGYYNIVNDDKTVREMQVTDLSKYDENDIRNVGWYYTAIKKGEAVWLEPYNFPGYDTKLISYTIPLYVNSELLGVLGFDMDFGDLLAAVENINSYEQGYALLIAADGETAYNEVEHIEEEEGHNHDHDPSAKATAELQNGMKLELIASYKEIQKDIRPMLSKIVIAFIVVLLFSIVYTVVVTYRMIRPLRQLTEVAEELSVGFDQDALAKMPVASKDEIGTLAKALKENYEQIREYTAYINALAYRDSLTGIKNSTSYTEAIEVVNKDINCGNPHFGVVVADINNLKLTNDKYGHDIGNELIIHTAKILTDIFKNSAVFRIGGDEFVIILKDDDYKNYRSLLDSLDEACSKDFITVSEEKISISLARGVASFDPEVDRIYEDVFAKADHAMYLNKNESKAALV